MVSQCEGAVEAGVSVSEDTARVVGEALVSQRSGGVLRCVFGIHCGEQKRTSDFAFTLIFLPGASHVLLIPNTPRPVMRWHLLATVLLLLDCIVQKEVYQDRVDICLRTLPQNLPPYELHTPDRTTAQLGLPL